MQAWEAKSPSELPPSGHPSDTPCKWQLQQMPLCSVQSFLAERSLPTSEAQTPVVHPTVTGLCLATPWLLFEHLFSL